MQGHTRKARIQHLQPWLVEPLLIGSGEGGDPIPSGEDALPPLVDAWAATLDKPGTRRAYLNDVVGFLDHLEIEGDPQLLTVRPRQVALWRDFLAVELESSRLSYQTVKRRMAAASNLYDFLNGEGHVIENQVRRVRRPKRPEAEKRKEQERLAEKAQQLVEHKCPLMHCPGAGTYTVSAATSRAETMGVPALLAQLDRRRGQQMTLW